MKELPKIIPIPVPKENKHPDTPYHPILPMHEFTWGVVAPKGSGKTTIVINMLLLYKGYFNQIYVLSPTIKNDDKWDFVKKQPLRKRNDKLFDILKKITEKEGDAADDNKMFPDLKKELDIQKKKFKPQIPAKNFIHDYTESTLKELLDEQDGMIEFLKEHGYSRYNADRVLFVFDDLVGSDLFNMRKDSVFKVFNVTHRHLGCSSFMCTQAYNEIPKTVRTQYTCMIVFRIGSDKEVEAVYNEFSMGLSKKEWEPVYRFCTDSQHDFMYVDLQKPRGQQIMKNFDTFIHEGENYEAFAPKEAPPPYQEVESKKRKSQVGPSLVKRIKK